VYDPIGIRTWKIEYFKNGVEKVLKAVKFLGYEREATQ